MLDHTKTRVLSIFSFCLFLCSTRGSDVRSSYTEDGVLNWATHGQFSNIKLAWCHRVSGGSMLPVSFEGEAQSVASPCRHFIRWEIKEILTRGGYCPGKCNSWIYRHNMLIWLIFLASAVTVPHSAFSLASLCILLPSSVSVHMETPLWIFSEDLTPL